MKTFVFSMIGCCLFGLTTGLLPFVGLAEEPEEKPRLPLAMEVFLKKPDLQWYELEVHLTNISEEPVQVDVRDLPWNPTDGSSWFLAVRLDAAHSPIKQETPHGRFGSRMVRLLPGESIQDKIGLNPRFPSLLEDIAQSGVQLAWDCPPSDLKFVCKEGAPQSMTIPKADPGRADDYVIDRQACLAREEAIGLIDIPQDHEVLFLMGTETIMTDLEQMKTLLLQVDDYVRHCHPTWTNSWAVSFFTDKKFAGFLGEGDSQSYFERGLWQQANIGQYSSQIRTLFRFPWIKKKSDTVYLSIFQLQQHGHT
ncbi:MAG: hypothetical protein AB7P17_14705 [Nitrospirales bacterium]